MQMHTHVDIYVHALNYTCIHTYIHTSIHTKLNLNNCNSCEAIKQKGVTNNIQNNCVGTIVCDNAKKVYIITMTSGVAYIEMLMQIKFSGNK